MRLIDHRRRLAAIAAERAHLHPHIQAREPDDPGPRFVAALCPRPAVNTGQADCAICDQEDAERFARARLMPAEAFAPVAARILSSPSCTPPHSTRSRSHAARRGAKTPLRPKRAGTRIAAL
jgi:hypothetical protein